jgi:hypothetical protein
MAKKNTKLQAAVKRTADILQAHLDTLPTAEAKAMRKDLHSMAIRTSRSARRGKGSKSPKSAGLRLLSRSSAKPA